MFAIAAALCSTTATCRDRFLFPYSPASIWNTALGSDAVFVPVNLFAGPPPAAHSPRYYPNTTTCANETAHPLTRHTCPGAFGGITQEQCEHLGCCFSKQRCPGGKPCPWCFTADHIVGPRDFHSDHETILRATAADPFVPWIDQGWWGPASEAPTRNNSNCNSSADLQCHCDVAPGAQTLGLVQLPARWTSDRAGNNGMAVLAADNVTVFQTQPAYRCARGGPLLSKREGCPQAYPANGSALGGGPETALGAHGGSGLSVFGGTVRVHELGPDAAAPIAHAIKLELWGHAYYYRGPGLGGHALQPPTAANGGRTQYVWPATGSDSCSLHYADAKNVYNGSDPWVAPGALLAIPAVVPPLPLGTVLGRKIERALRDYGGYLVDDTAHDSGAICFEAGADVAVERLYNFTLDTQGGPWYDDLLRIFKALHAVANNAPGSVGGGGQRRQPPLAPLCV